MIKKLDSKIVYQNKWMQVLEDKVEFPNGDSGIYGYLKKHDTSLVIPFDGEYFTIVGQFRYPIQDYSWEFPIGHNEEDKDNVFLAKEELHEETGLVAENMEHLGGIYVGDGLMSGKTHVYLATKLTQGKQQLEATEEIEVKQVSIDELEEMIITGTFIDGPSVSGYGLLKIKKPELFIK